MTTLGINAAFHDSSACLVRDGALVAAAEEERFTRIKHAKRPIPFSAYELPFHAIHYCLDQGNLFLDDVDHVAYSFNPDLMMTAHSSGKIEIPIGPPGMAGAHGHSSWDPLFYAYIRNAPGHLRDGVPHHLGAGIWRGKDAEHYTWHFVDHHLAHAASAFLVSPFASAAILTLDGRGENATTAFCVGKGNEIATLQQVCMPHSLGLLYEKVTTHLGFLHSSDEYKVMALASYGKPAFLDVFRSLVNVRSDGTYETRYDNLEACFGAPRSKGGPLEERHFDIARSLQAVLEESVLKLIRWLHAETAEEALCLAGGVALNCVMNSKIRDLGPFKKIWVQPASGDSGTALGAAFWIDGHERERPRTFVMDNAYWGPEFSDDEILQVLESTKTPFRHLNDLPVEIAQLLAHEKIIGWFQGRMEFGPRALGNRSILASPVSTTMQARLNGIKGREEFRPVAPVVLEEAVGQWFEPPANSPFMLFVSDVKKSQKAKIPAVCHVDRTARIQTIRRAQNPRYYDLIRAFGSMTGVPILINTSFNTAERPIVCTPQDALECFWVSPLDALVLGSFLIGKDCPA